MDRIVPITELRANLAEVTRWVERKRQPVLLTKNGHAKYVLIDIKSYEKLIGEDEESIRKASRQSHGAPAGFVSDIATKSPLKAAPVPEEQETKDMAQDQVEAPERVEQPVVPTETVEPQRHANPEPEVSYRSQYAPDPIAERHYAEPEPAPQPRPVTAKPGSEKDAGSLPPELLEEEARILKELGIE